MYNDFGNDFAYKITSHNRFNLKMIKKKESFKVAWVPYINNIYPVFIFTYRRIYFHFL